MYNNYTHLGVPLIDTRSLTSPGLLRRHIKGATSLPAGSWKDRALELPPRCTKFVLLLDNSPECENLLHLGCAIMQDCLGVFYDTDELFWLMVPLALQGSGGWPMEERGCLWRPGPLTYLLSQNWGAWGLPLGPSSTAAILDCGCGQGRNAVYLTLALRNHIANFSMVGVDNRRAMCDKFIRFSSRTLSPLGIHSVSGPGSSDATRVIVTEAFKVSTVAAAASATFAAATAAAAAAAAASGGGGVSMGAGSVVAPYYHHVYAIQQDLGDYFKLEGGIGSGAEAVVIEPGSEVSDGGYTTPGSGWCPPLKQEEEEEGEEEVKERGGGESSSSGGSGDGGSGGGGGEASSSSRPTPPPSPTTSSLAPPPPLPPPPPSHFDAILFMRVLHRAAISASSDYLHPERGGVIACEIFHSTATHPTSRVQKLGDGELLGMVRVKEGWESRLVHELIIPSEDGRPLLQAVVWVGPKKE